MILVIDIGNTNAVVGGVQDREIRFTRRLPSDRNWTTEQFRENLQQQLEEEKVDLAQIKGGILSSVVPVLTDRFLDALEQLTGKRFLNVTVDLCGDVPIHLDNPSQLGTDQLVDAVAALASYTPPLAIIDMGTATTVSVVDPEGAYAGGIIAPGLGLSMDALSNYAAQLPQITLKDPVRVIGTNTVDCMTSGAIYGHAAMLDGVISRMEKELGQAMTVVATGGLMRLVLPHCEREVHYHENLLLEGLAILYEKNMDKA